jgi:hypothetical protein
MVGAAVGVTLAASLVLFAVVFAWIVGPVPLDYQLAFVDQASNPVVTVWGDVHVNISGSWTASTPTWPTWGYSEPHSTPLCYPRCGNGSTAGTVDYASDFCTSWPDGGTSYGWGSTITIYIGFAAAPGRSDSVSLHATATVTHSSQCA